jgi:hypothetical protein
MGNFKIWNTGIGNINVHELRCQQNPTNINTAPQFEELSYNFMTNIGFKYVSEPFHFVKDELIVYESERYNGNCTTKPGQALGLELRFEYE